MPLAVAVLTAGAVPVSTLRVQELSGAVVAGRDSLKMMMTELPSTEVAANSGVGSTPSTLWPDWPPCRG